MSTASVLRRGASIARSTPKSGPSRPTRALRLPAPPTAPAAPKSKAQWKQVAQSSLPPPPSPKVLHQDRNLLIVDKPTNVSLQGSYGSESRRRWDSILKDLRTKYPDSTIGPVHRLDKGTTGTLLLSLSTQSHKLLSRQISSHEISRHYLALVRGRIKEGYQGTIEVGLRTDDDLVRIEGHSSEKRLEQVQMGLVKNSKTEWKCLRESERGYSLILLSPETGRKHQLRVHCANVLKAPIVGDHKYSRGFVDERNADREERLGQGKEGGWIDEGDGMYLHAWTMRLHTWDKTTGKRKTVGAVASLPYDWKRMMRKLKWDEPKVETTIEWRKGYEMNEHGNVSRESAEISEM